MNDNIISDGVASELLRYGFVVVERSRLNAVLEELNLNMNGILLPENLKKVGNILNVDALVFVAGNFDGNFTSKVGSANAKIVDVESGVLLGGISYQNGSGCGAGSPCDGWSKEGSISTVSKIAREIAKGLGKVDKR